MTSAPIKILIVEHDPNDLELIHYELRKGEIDYQSQIVQNEGDFRNALLNFIPDIILCDYSLPAFDGPTAFKIREELAADTPFIFVSGNIGEENSIEFIKRGVTDYVLKDKLFTLITKFKRAVNDSKENQQKKIIRHERKLSESRLKDAQAIAHIGSWEIDMLTNTQTWSDELFAIFGTNQLETQPSVAAYLSFVHPDDLQFVKGKVESAFRTIKDSSYDFRLIRKDGVVRHAYAKSHFDFDNDHKPLKRYGIIQDITEIKQAENKIKKANRLYAFISQINQSIVHLKDDASLFRRACQIGIEFGHFKISWIGMFDEDAQEKMTLVEHCGINETVNLLTEAPFSSTVSRLHITKTGTYFMSNDIENDPRLIDWRLFANKYGIRSCIVLPIKKSGVAVGTFNLYSGELDFFDMEEIALMEEVTGDISFALDVFETARKHSVSEDLVIKNEKRFRALIEKGSDLIAMRSPEGIISYVSPSFAQVIGYTIEELLKTSVFDIIHPDEIAGLQKKTKAILEKPGSYYFSQQRYRNKDGQWIWCEGTVTNMLHEPGVLALVSNFKDITERKTAEEKLALSADSLQRAMNDLQKTMDSSLDVICSIDSDGRFAKVSAASQWVWGYQPEELIGKMFMNYVFHEDVESTIRMNGQIMSGVPVTMFENRYVRKDGSIVPILWSASWDEKDQLVYCVAKDATEKKNLEQQQEFDRTNLNALINNTSDLMWSVDRELNLITSNKPLDYLIKKNTGKGLVKGSNMLAFALSKDQANRFKKHYERAFEGEIFSEIEYTESPESWSEISYYPIYKKEVVVGTACFSRDISVQKKSENHLLLLESVITHTNDAVLITEAESIDEPGPKIIYVNKAFTQMTGYESNEVMGKSPRFLQGAKTDRNQLDEIRNALDKSLSLEVEIVNYKKDKEEFWNNFTIVPVTNKDGWLTHCISIQRDVTARKEQEESTRKNLERLVEERTRELNEALTKEKDLVEMKSKFVSIASHEFRTPLSTISFAAESIRNYFHQLTAEEIQRKLIKIEDQASHMTNLLEDILTLGKAEAGKIKLKRISLDLKEFIESLIEEVRATVKGKRKIDFTFTCSANKINADDKLLRNVFNNLLTNALKFSPADSIVTIAVSDCAGEVLIEVTDQGIGIEESELKSVFESFQRGSNASAVQGTGLGLSILKKAVEIMNGTIEVKSVLNQGSVFSVKLPL